MKKSLLIISIIFQCIDLMSQDREIDYKYLFVDEIMSDTVIEGSKETSKSMRCIINNEAITVFNLFEPDSVSRFQILSRSLGQNGIEEYTCLLDGIKYNLLFSPNDVSLVILSEGVRYGLYTSTKSKRNSSAK